MDRKLIIHPVIVSFKLFPYYLVRIRLLLSIRLYITLKKMEKNYMLDFFQSQETLTAMDWILRATVAYFFLLVVAKVLG